jgi:PAS domain S-box-containing protein
MDVTARKLTEVELRRSKAHLADAQTLSRTGSVGMEVSTKRIFWSEEAARIYGYPPGTEPTPDLILQRAHPDDVGLLKGALERAAQGGSDFNCEHRLLMPDGSIKHLHDLTHCFRDAAGNEEIVGAIMDITERKLTEEAIRRSEAYLAEAQRLSHTGSFGWRVSSAEIFWSDETFRIFQCDPDMKPTLEFTLARVHPKDRELVQQQIERASRDERAFDFENRLQMADGSIKHVRVTAHPSRDGAGNFEFVGAVTDVSEQRLAEAAIREGEREVRLILDLAPQLIAVYGPNRERIYANRVLLDYFGQSLEEWRQSPGNVHPDDNGRIDVVFDHSVTRGSADELEMRLRKHDGSYRWFLVRLNPLWENWDRLHVGILPGRTSTIASRLRMLFAAKTSLYVKKSIRPRCSKRLLEPLQR